MKTLDQLAAEQAKARAMLEREIAIASVAAVAPIRVQPNSSGLATWLTYEAPTLVDALAIMHAAPIVPCYAYKGTFTRIQPETLATEKSGERAAGPFAASVSVSQGEGYGPSAELRFFVMAGDELCEAHISIGAPNRTHFPLHKYGARFIENTRGRVEVGRGRDTRRGDWEANTLLSAMSDHRIKWGTGGEGASFQYFWMSDTEDGGADHASAQIVNLHQGV